MVETGYFLSSEEHDGRTLVAQARPPRPQG